MFLFVCLFVWAFYFAYFTLLSSSISILLIVSMYSWVVIACSIIELCIYFHLHFLCSYYISQLFFSALFLLWYWSFVAWYMISHFYVEGKILLSILRVFLIFFDLLIFYLFSLFCVVPLVAILMLVCLHYFFYIFFSFSFCVFVILTFFLLILFFHILIIFSLVPLFSCMLFWFSSFFSFFYFLYKAVSFVFICF